MDSQTLKEILHLHRLWHCRDGRGKRANLKEANLESANLKEANLEWADLRGIDLEWAGLRRANLRGIDLQEANLQGTSLQGAVGILRFGPVGEHNRMCHAVRHDNCVMIHAGCFWGSLDEAKSAIREKYGENSDYEQLAVDAANRLLAE